MRVQVLTVVATKHRPQVQSIIQKMGLQQYIEAGHMPHMCFTSPQTVGLKPRVLTQSNCPPVSFAQNVQYPHILMTNRFFHQNERSQLLDLSYSLRWAWLWHTDTNLPYVGSVQEFMDTTQTLFNSYRDKFNTEDIWALADFLHSPFLVSVDAWLKTNFPRAFARLFRSSRNCCLGQRYKLNDQDGQEIPTLLEFFAFDWRRLHPIWPRKNFSQKRCLQANNSVAMLARQCQCLQNGHRGTLNQRFLRLLFEMHSGPAYLQVADMLLDTIL